MCLFVCLLTKYNRHMISWHGELLRKGNCKHELSHVSEGLKPFFCSICIVAMYMSNPFPISLSFGTIDDLTYYRNYDSMES